MSGTPQVLITARTVQEMRGLAPWEILESAGLEVVGQAEIPSEEVRRTPGPTRHACSPSSTHRGQYP